MTANGTVFHKYLTCSMKVMTTMMICFLWGSSLAILVPGKYTKGTPNPTANFPRLPQNNSGGISLFLMLTFTAFLLGNWSGIKATFTFERMASYFFIHVYGPCALIVIISWVSFLLPRSSPPARVTLGVTSVLTVVTILNMLNNSMPKVPYFLNVVIVM